MTFNQRQLPSEMPGSYPGGDNSEDSGKANSSKDQNQPRTHRQSIDGPSPSSARRISIASPSSRSERFGDVSSFMTIPDDVEDPQQEYNSIILKDPAPGTVFHIYDQTADDHSTQVQSAHERAFQLGGRVVIVIAECRRSYTCLALCAHTDNDPKAENHWRACGRDSAQAQHAHPGFQPLLIDLTLTRAKLRPNITINIEGYSTWSPRCSC